jgi:hypothetical protein
VDAWNGIVPRSVRAEWVSDLLRAIDEAQWLAWRVGVVEGRNAQALELYVELELVRAEVEAMRRPLNALRNLASAGEWLEK